MEKRGNTLELHVPEGTSQEVQDWLKAEVMKLFRAIKLRDRCGKDCSLDHAEANKHRPELALADRACHADFVATSSPGPGRVYFRFGGFTVRTLPGVLTLPAGLKK